MERAGEESRIVKGVEVRVYCDAGFKKKTGAWGAVVVRDSAPAIRIEASGRLQGELRSSTSAEIRSAANAIHAALKAGLIKPGDRVLVLCDNSPAVDRINDLAIKGKRKTADLGEIAAWIRQLASDRGFDLSAKWIKGHRPLDGTEEVALNRRADQLCGIALGIRNPPTRKGKAAAASKATALKASIEAADRLRAGI